MPFEKTWFLLDARELVGESKQYTLSMDDQMEPCLYNIYIFLSSYT